MFIGLYLVGFSIGFISHFIAPDFLDPDALVPVELPSNETIVETAA